MLRFTASLLRYILLPLFAHLSLLAIARPHSVPLAIRSPSLNAWYTLPTGGSPSDAEVIFQTNKNWGTEGLIQVDGINQTYVFIQEPSSSYRQGVFEDEIVITPTQTSLAILAGPIRLRVTWLSPIEPDDWVKLSFPFSYVTMTAESMDGLPHSVVLYFDITGEWIAGNNIKVRWSTEMTSKTIFHQIQRYEMPFDLREDDFGMSENDIVYFATASRVDGSVTWRSGAGFRCQEVFTADGKLPDTPDSDFRKVNERGWPTTAFSVDLGDVTSTTEPAVFAIGKSRDNAIQDRGVERSSYFRSAYGSSISVGIDAFLEDYPNAKRRADEFDRKIQTEASKVSSRYAELLALGTRQVLGATELTIARGSDGNWNHSDVKMFMRKMGSSAGRTVSPVEEVYAAYPAFLYLNTSLAGRLLEPLLQNQRDSSPGSDYAAPNLGISYPVVAGSVGSNQEGVENSASIIIMALAHAKFSGDGSMLSKYYPMLKRWGDFLIENSLYPTNQVSVDTSQRRNATNLAIKGIIAIQALAEISAAVSQSDDKQRFSNAAASMVEDWTRVAFTGNHLLAVYGDQTSGGLMYNLFADVLLQTRLVNDSIYEAQSEFYWNQIASGSSRTFKSSLETTGDLANTVKTHWTMMAAASTRSNAARDLLVDDIYNRAFDSKLPGHFPTTYDSNTGSEADGASSAAQGALFSFLALQLEPQPLNIDSIIEGSSTPEPGARHTNTQAIVGGVIGGVAAVVILVGLALILKHGRDKRRRAYAALTPIGYTATSGPVVHLPSPPESGTTQTPFPLSKSHNRAVTASASGGSTREVMEGGGSVSDTTIAGELRQEMAELRSAVSELALRDRDTGLPPLYASVAGH
ncbi:hypothetical protein BDV98DRAFT_607320 [Pterulicium gracile]|uniref:DUF1793-domain-containing protein n=1 Tax=Pterulicium gracile TaxID=1884261 RepID=A0A5C3QBQ3_9AGAR|nr:hypothetical protein BDV98DRAFT_607320 [Pterula gracilis]